MEEMNKIEKIIRDRSMHATNGLFISWISLPIIVSEIKELDKMDEGLKLKLCINPTETCDKNGTKKYVDSRWELMN